MYWIQFWCQVILFNEIPDKDTTTAFQHYIQRHESNTPPYTQVSQLYIMRICFTIPQLGAFGLEWVLRQYSKR